MTYEQEVAYVQHAQKKVRVNENKKWQNVTMLKYIEELIKELGV